jgi:hypothetical protein
MKKMQTRIKKAEKVGSLRRPVKRLIHRGERHYLRRMLTHGQEALEQ